MRNRLLTILFLLLIVSGSAKAQMPGGVPVTVSHETQVVNGHKYYIHIVQRGQTVYAITRAYGLKEYDAVVKKDIHFLSIGDTVWLPCRDGNAPAETKPAVPAAKNEVARAEASKKTTAVAKQDKHENHGESEPAVAATPRDTAFIRPRVNPDRVVISLMMPLHLDQLSSLATATETATQSKPLPRAFEFIQFYEGVMLGIQQLERQGIAVTLNVVDVPDNRPETVERLFSSHNVAQSDLLIALLTRAPFAKAAELARRNHLMIVNPIATRREIVESNPYVFKCAPSDEAKLRRVFNVVHDQGANTKVILIHSGGESDRALLQTATRLLDERGDIQYSVLGWDANSKLPSLLEASRPTVVVSLFNQDAQRNRIYASRLLNKLSSRKENPPTLISLDDWSRLYSDVDFNQLQQLSYQTFYIGLDADNATHTDFLARFREDYRTSPVEQYAALGNDIVIFFATGLDREGSNFWRHPVLGDVEGMLYPMSFGHQGNAGYENTRPQLYRMSKYAFHAVQ